MGAAPLSFVAAVCALASFFLPFRLCAAETVYAEKQSSIELPCSCPSCSGEHREVNWLFYRDGNTTTIFHKVTHSRLPAALGHLAMLQNHSLCINNVTDNDTGRYWCEQMYYDLVVVTGSKRMMESGRADVACYALSCSVSIKELVWDVASWWEGGKKLKEEDEKREYSIFKGKRASQLHICLTKDQGKESKKEGRRTRERKVKCRFGKRMEITFGLTGNEQDPWKCHALLVFCQGQELMNFLPDISDKPSPSGSHQSKIQYNAGSLHNHK
ncbi:lymphocyte antigen 6 complex locus protein G6f [Tiliqua scincoides]|uniref:lymphocyte antigen 6 complex locus protein G6f n=1 Tax=Tiliqua scincoides TaxID=71010 RepID=UPI003461FC6C